MESVRKESKRITFKRLYPVKYKTTSHDLFFNTGLVLQTAIEHPAFSIEVDGWLTIHEGYSFDGASGPAIDTECFMRGAAAHDALYQAKQLDFPLPADWKEKADRLLVRLCREDGMGRLRAAWVYQAVKRFGRGLPRDLNKYDETLIAP